MKAYIRKPLTVEAVQLSEDTVAEIKAEFEKKGWHTASTPNGVVYYNSARNFVDVSYSFMLEKSWLVIPNDAADTDFDILTDEDFRTNYELRTGLEYPLPTTTEDREDEDAQ